MRFAITGLPRSRTKWASVFLSTPDCVVTHDSMDGEAISTTMVLDHWEKLDCKIVVIRRNLTDVINSLAGYKVSHAQLLDADRKMRELIKSGRAMVIEYDDFDARKLWRYCYESDISNEYVEVFEDMNITQHSMIQRAA